MRGTWFWRPLALPAALVLFSACANPFVGQAKSPVLTAPSANPSPTPLAAATPTGPLTASAPSLKVGEVNAVYPQLAFSATGGRPPYQWTVYAGAPPPGMSLGTDGSLNGSPTAAGTFKFVAQVADSGTSTATAPGQIVIKPALVASLLPPCATACAVEIPCADVCGLFGTVNGGVAPYTYSVTSGTVPSGTALANNAFRLTGFFRGGPGFLQFTASVKDGLGQTF
ncbi:MAG TPA: hypothetical protein VJT78_06530, partial [Candidatus Dormibacteraeota bacterium]|nr:hypothetical protein [Candidatus Dormibacteraeota bacterium]